MSQKQLMTERFAEGTLQQILNQLKTVIAHDTSAILLLDDGQLRPVAVSDHSRAQGMRGVRYRVEQSAALCHLLERGEPVIFTEQPEEDPFHCDFCLGPGCSCVNVPLLVGERPIGVLSINKRGGSSYGTEEARVAFAFARQAALAIERAQLYVEARRLALCLRTAAEVGQRVTALLDLDPLLAQVVDLIRENFGYYQVHILLVDHERGEIFLREASGPEADLIKARGLRLKIGEEGITGWVAQMGQAILCHDVRQEPRYYAEELLPEARSELAVPLRVGDRIVGVLDIQSDVVDAFHEEDVTALQLLGGQVAIAIENARLFQETERRFEAMRALHETSLDIISQLDMSKLLQALLRRAAHLSGAEGGALFLYEEDEGLIRNVANYNTWRDWMNVTVLPGEGVIGQVILTGEPLIVNDYDHYESKTEVFAGAPHTVVMGTPLRWQGRIIGGLVVLNRPQARIFDQNDLWLLSLFADMAAIALKNADLYAKVKELSQTLERRVHMRTQELLQSKEEVAKKAEQVRRLLAQMVDIQESERARLARDVHDEVIQLVIAALCETQAAKESLPFSSGASREKLEISQELLKRAEAEMRRVIYDLKPPTLDLLGLVPALRQFAANCEKQDGFTCSIDVSGTPFRLPVDTEVAMYRIAQEALQNVLRHATARMVRIFVNFDPARVRVVVQDDGRGFDYQKALLRNHGSWGLIGMQERAQSIGGQLEIQSESGQGTRVVLEVPVADS